MDSGCLRPAVCTPNSTVCLLYTSTGMPSCGGIFFPGENKQTSIRHRQDTNN